MYDLIASAMQFGVHSIQEACEQRREALQNPGMLPTPIY